MLKYRLHLAPDQGLQQKYDEATAALPPHTYGKYGRNAHVLGHLMSEGAGGTFHITVSEIAPDIHPELAARIKRVTVVDQIYVGFRTEGVYELNGAKLWLKNSRDETGSGYEYQVRDCQAIEIVAPSVETARAIYEAVRTGALQPTLGFEAGGRDEPRAAEPAADAAAPPATE